MARKSTTCHRESGIGPPDNPNEEFDINSRNDLAITRKRQIVATIGAARKMHQRQLFVNDGSGGVNDDTLSLLNLTLNTMLPLVELSKKYE
jgi:hypothetical protein